ncbi:hypothetical protein TNCV_3520181 [Trichonephila clavipes]|nr:hypothetical protein TNCV_3520181 [Trichonephila clavipes]
MSLVSLFLHLALEILAIPILLLLPIDLSKFGIYNESSDFCLKDTLGYLSIRVEPYEGRGPKREIRRSPNVSFNKSIVARAVRHVRCLVGTTAPGHHDCSIQGMLEMLVIMKSPQITIDCNIRSLHRFLKKDSPARKARQTVSFSGCDGVSTYTCGLASLKCGSLFVDT